MGRNSMFGNPKSILVIVACVCFAIGVLVSYGTVTLDAKINWTDLGLLFGFLSFIV